MEGHCSTGQTPQWAVVPVEKEEYRIIKWQDNGYELIGQFWEEICLVLSQVLSRDMSKGTEEISKEPQDNQSLKNSQTEYLPNTFTQSEDNPACSREFEQPKATYRSDDFYLNSLFISAFTKGHLWSSS